ncbi:bifunctional metallophosphatase/5'-nucleotidase [Pseudodonghicola flavimaris]|uniref:5'-nucleotidase C-terminal domain-containing protein n=1 Tax=Pseudodonghicola flavimaris TaxID=3050036 RepID=A0ABT7EW85_9RHOB|nr:5'-nucleotidase C-terminal domain-containing protein [Pseudodonghicola flavimaris]MDK3016605.1 5'-nucleotidase C-terminal domain-containing protein [Pseudodonghicola flavimaris]
MSRLTRRGFLARSSALAAAAAVSPVIVSRARANPGPGQLAMVSVAPNPRGSIEKLYLLKGDPLAGPITTILAEDGAAEPARALPDGTRRVLRLMHYNDMHNHMTDLHPKRGDTHRLAQMVQQVNAAKAAAADDEIVLFLSGGDDHTGSVFDELLGWSPEEFVADAGYRAASAAGVDLAVLGNHEFDRGAAQLKIGLDRDAAFPVLSANVHSSAHIARDVDYTPAAVAEVKGLRIGFIGLTTAIDTRTGMESDPTLAVASPVESAANLYKAVEAVSDVVVILSHCGYGRGMHKSGKAAAARLIGEGDFDIADAIGPMSEKPVVLIGGHSHTALNAEGIDADNMVAGLLLTQAKANGQFLGEIAMSVAKGQGRDQWFSSVALHPVKRRDDRLKPGDDGYDRAEHDGDYDAGFEAQVMAPMIAALDGKLSEVIAEVADDTLVSTPRTVADRYVGEVAIGNLMNDTLVKRSASFPGGPVDFSLFNATGLARGIDKGPLTFREWFDVMPYADVIDVATLTGAQIRDMLTSNARRILRPEEVAGTDLTGFVSRGFLHFSSGIRYRIALGASAADARAVDITLNGTPVEELLDQSFTMAFNSYISLGAFGETWNGKPIGGGVAGEIPSFDVRGLPWNHTGLVYRNELIAALREIGTISETTGVVLDGRLALA